MEKLIKLLNEYEENRIEKINSEWKLMVKLSFKPYSKESLTNKAYRSCQLEICFRYYGFIKWLVDNDKIDYTQLEWYSLWETVKNDWWTNYICLLMILAVSDSPIESLTLYLK